MSTPLTGINPDILIWARERSGQTVEDVAKRLKKDPAVISLWETGEAAPTYVQLENLAYVVYKRPIAIFFFPSPPEEPTPETSFRTLPDFEIAKLNADTRFKIRKARALQLSLVELHDGVNPSQTPVFRALSASPGADIIDLSNKLRNHLSITLQDQQQWTSSRDALEMWRTALEGAGVYVFKDSFKQSDVSGFCLVSDEFPIIYVNNSTSPSRQIFTLIHELAHILLHTDGITKLDASFIDSLTGASRQIELFCNRFSGEFLVPTSDFENRLPLPNYDDATIVSLAERYWVSREVILRKLFDQQLVSADSYRDRVAAWNEEYAQSRKEGAGGNYYATQAAYLGQRYLALAFGRYYQGRLSLQQLAEYLNVKASSVAGLEPFGLR